MSHRTPDLVHDKNKAHRRIAHLSSPDSRDRPGSVEFTIGYYGKLPPNPKACKDKNPDEVGRDPGLPKDFDIEDPDSQDNSAIGDIEKAVLRCPPDDEWVSGIVSIQVHEIRDLGTGRGERVGTKQGDWGSGVKDIAKHAVGINQEGEKGSDEQGEDEEGDELPSSYCTVYVPYYLVLAHYIYHIVTRSLNDDLVISSLYPGASLKSDSYLCRYTKLV
jgi:hypothetical protein